MQMIIIIVNVQLFIQSKFKGEFADGKCSLTKFLPTYRKSGRVESVGTVVGQVGPTTYNVWQPSTKKIYIIWDLTVAGCSRVWGRLVGEGLIIRRSQVRVLVGPPTK